MSIGLMDVLQHRAMQKGAEGEWWCNPGKYSEGGMCSDLSVVEGEVFHNISTCRVFGNLNFPHATRALVTSCFFYHFKLEIFFSLFC